MGRKIEVLEVENGFVCVVQRFATRGDASDFENKTLVFTTVDTLIKAISEVLSGEKVLATALEKGKKAAVSEKMEKGDPRAEAIKEVKEPTAPIEKEPAAKTEAATEEVNFETLRRTCTANIQRIALTKRARVVEILASFGVKKLPELTDENLPALAVKLEEVDAE